MLDVGNQRILDRADAAVFDLGVAPGVVGELGVDGDTDHFHATLVELFQTVIEGNQLGRADEGEIERIEEQDGCLALDVGCQVEGVNDLAIAQNGSSGEIAGRPTNTIFNSSLCEVNNPVRIRLPRAKSV